MLKKYRRQIWTDILILSFGLLESAPSDSAMTQNSTYPQLSELFGRKRKKRTSIETNIRLTLEKRFQDVSNIM